MTTRLCYLVGNRTSFDYVGSISDSRQIRRAARVGSSRSGARCHVYRRQYRAL